MMTGTAIILGNAFSLCAMVTDSISGTRKKHGEIMAIQIASQFFYGASSIALQAYSSTVQNGVSVFRNLAAIKKPKSRIIGRIIEWTLILAGVVFGIVFNNRGLLGWLPIVANLEYSISVFAFRENEIALKTAFIINAAMFAVFNAVIMNYVGVVSCAVITVTTSIFLIKAINKKLAVKKETKAANDENN